MHPTFRRRSAAVLAAAATALLAAPATGAVVGPEPGAAVTGDAPPATRLQLNPDGLGHVHLVPLYTVQGGYDTYLTLLNTDTRNGKAVKVRFRSAANADTVFDFTLLLGAGDTWSAAVTRDAATGLPRLAYADTSCTLPADVRQTFRTARLSPTLTEAERVRQAASGGVEIITMADIPGPDPRVPSPLLQAVTPVREATPCTPGVLAPLAVDIASVADMQARGLAFPTTGLRVQWVLINVPGTLTFSGASTALEARTDAGRHGHGNFVLFPQTDVPVAPLSRLRPLTTDPILRGGVADLLASPPQSLDGVVPTVAAVESDLPDLSTPYLPAVLAEGLPLGRAARRQADHVNRALAVTSLANEYVIEPAVRGRTDWVVAAPTVRYQAGVRYHSMSAAAHALVFTNLAVDDGGAAMAPSITNLFGAAAPDAVIRFDYQPDRYRIQPPSATIDPTSYETRRLSDANQTRDGRRGWEYSFVITGTAAPSSRLHVIPGAVAIYPFHTYDGGVGVDAGSVIGLAAGDPMRSWFVALAPAGWSRTYLPGSTGQGFPLIGFAAIELFNGAARPGVSGSYGITLPHAYTRP